MVSLAQGLIPMLPVTQLVSVRTARGDVVYMAPMQPIAEDQPGVQSVDRVTTRTHATETTTTRTMTTEMVRSESESGKITRDEWERERKEKKRQKKRQKKEKKEKKEKKRERERGGDEDGRDVVKRPKSGWKGWIQNDDVLRLDDSYDASLQSGPPRGF
jgi:ABC-type transporter lipoprotein component MlaA